jgi:hypothetical protein
MDVSEESAFGRAIFGLWQVNVDGKNAQRFAGSGLFSYLGKETTGN